MKQHWPIVLWGVGATAGSVWWVFNQVFATRNYIKTIITEHEMREFTMEETAHGHIRDNISTLHERVEQIDKKLSDLKNILIKFRDSV